MGIDRSFQSAGDDYNKAALLSPDCAEIYHLRGLLCVELNDFEGAVVDLSHARDLEPENEEIVTHLNLVIAGQRPLIN